MSARWRIDRLLLRPQAGQRGHLQIVDGEDGPAGRVVCVVPGHLGQPARAATHAILRSEAAGT